MDQYVDTRPVLITRDAAGLVTISQDGSLGGLPTRVTVSEETYRHYCSILGFDPLAVESSDG